MDAELHRLPDGTTVTSRLVTDVTPPQHRYVVQVPNEPEPFIFESLAETSAFLNARKQH